MKRIPLLVAVAVALVLGCGVSPRARAAGPMGTQIGWVIDNNGNALLTSSVCSQLSAADVGWVRMEFRLIPNHSTWDSAMLGYYDTVVNNARAAGLQVIGGIYSSAWPGTQAQQCANNWENTGGNGDNAYIDGFANTACVGIISHFHDRVKLWEIWNEPNSWTSSPSPGVFTGGSFIYPSNFSQVLANVYADVKEYNGIQDVSIISGGVFGHSINGVYSYTNAGAQYLDDTYNRGINSVGSFSYTKSHWGTYPLDGIGQHIYIDQGGATTSAEFKQYCDWVRSAYTKYEGTATGKKTYMTEFGWTTSSVTQTVQDQDLSTAFNTIKNNCPYVKNAWWFSWKDNPPANLYYGVLDSSGNHKVAYNDFTIQCRYEAHLSNGTINNNIQTYWNARGQAQLGNPYDNGGTPWVHSWSGAANVQDYDGGSHKRLCVFDSTYGTFECNDINGLWDAYLAHGGIGTNGPPVNNEYASGSGTRQDFQYHYLTWDPTNGVVYH